MTELFKKIPQINLSKKNIILMVLVLCAGFVLLIGEFVNKDKTEQVTVENTPVYAAQYTKETEKKLEDILSRVSGAGSVQVMLTLESCYENVYAKGYNSKSEMDDLKQEKEESEEYIIVKNGSNNEECLVIKVYEPTIKGVAIIAEGADDVNVKRAITETVCALFDISSAKVSVEKMIE